MSEHRPERPAGPLDRNPPPNVWERGSSNRPSRKPPGWWYYLVMFLTAGLIGLLVAIGLRRKGIWETNPDPGGENQLVGRRHRADADGVVVPGITVPSVTH